MPIVYEVREGGTFVSTRATGEVTNQDLLDYQAAVLSDPRVRPGFDELFNATAAFEAGLSEEAIEQMIEVDREHVDKLRRGKCAIVVRSGFELAKHFEQTHGGPHNVVVFYNLDVALVWLGRGGALRS